MTTATYDVIVIGAGPGGYVAAIRASQLGMKVACVEKRTTLGGTCLNVGCIPSKALLAASEKYESVKHQLAGMGIRVSGVDLDLPQMMAHKTKVVDANTKGIEFLFKKNKVDWLKGTGSIPAAGQVAVDGQLYSAKHIIIASGSDSVDLPGIAVDEKRIVTSTGALELDRVPGHLVVIGGGVIGLELGCVWARLGSKVTVVEYMDRILATMDSDLSKESEKIFTKQGLVFKTSTKVLEAKTHSSGVTLTLEPAAGGPAETLEADIVLVAVGRKPHTETLGLKALGVALDARGRIAVDDHFRTNIPGLYAIGDVIAGPMLAHKAEEEGVILAEMLAGQTGHIDYDKVPGVVYTHPEIASVGKTEAQLKAAGIDYAVGKFPFSANGRARAMGAMDGFVKILADKKTDKLLGVHIIGPEAGTLIAEAVTILEFGGSSEDIFRTPHAHPTLNEVVKEAALATHGRAVHM